MKTPEDKDQAFPEGYEHVEQRLNETIDLVDQLDKQAETVPPDAGATLTLDPNGSFKRRTLGTREMMLEFLKSQKDRIKADTWEKTEKDTRDAETKAGRVIRDNVREKLYPNPFRKLSKDELSKAAEEIRDMDASQDFMDALIVEYKGREPDTEKSVQDTPKAKTASVSLSMRFTQSLGYTNVSENVETALNPVTRQSPERDRE